ncbi:MAG TPA: type II toxin-antitoxin system VapC family toxin [Longimicrobiaceae bacterium]|jgi:tRNA(fMet)-specific endonuclease VapC|nr:type II toxin-antitoxin system VapC family toxin [Longimicrobiaceae bacterium]
MAGKILLDTSVVVDLFSKVPSVERLLKSAEAVYLPSIVLGELLYGAESSRRIAEGLAQVEAFAESTIPLACDHETARFYGKIKNGLRAKGRPIPENDIWIAALARQHGITLATRDAHFREIDGLPLLSW